MRYFHNERLHCCIGNKSPLFQTLKIPASKRGDFYLNLQSHRYPLFINKYFVTKENLYGLCS